MNGPSTRSLRWLSTPTMARALGIQAETLRRYARRGLVPREYIHPMGRRFRWRSDFSARPVFLAVPDIGPLEPS